MTGREKARRAMRMAYVRRECPAFFRPGVVFTPAELAAIAEISDAAKGERRRRRAGTAVSQGPNVKRLIAVRTRGEARGQGQVCPRCTGRSVVRSLCGDARCERCGELLWMDWPVYEQWALGNSARREVSLMSDDPSGGFLVPDGIAELIVHGGEWYPRSAFQAWKARWLPGWLTSLWPVRLVWRPYLLPAPPRHALSYATVTACTFGDRDHLAEPCE